MKTRAVNVIADKKKLNAYLKENMKNIQIEIPDSDCIEIRSATGTLLCGKIKVTIFPDPCSSLSYYKFEKNGKEFMRLCEAPDLYWLELDPEIWKHGTRILTGKGDMSVIKTTDIAVEINIFEERKLGN